MTAGPLCSNGHEVRPMRLLSAVCLGERQDEVWVCGACDGRYTCQRDVPPPRRLRIVGEPER
jgi:hypothetical protein